ncbi:MAG: GNAT family N-acetyltransferase [Pyrinomonadaceae bacterium]
MREEQQLKITFREATVADALAVGRVQVQSWRESFVGIVPQTFLDKMSVENRAKKFEEGFAVDFYKMFVAETQENGIVGFADFGKARDNHNQYEAELYAIYLLRDFQRKGIGGKLFDLGVQSLVAQNMNSLSLTALEISPYKPFYEKMGGHFVERKTTNIEGESYATVVYGWDRLVAS